MYAAKSVLTRTVNTIILGEESSTSLIKGVAFGTVKPGQKVQLTLYLLPMGSAGERTIDISIQSRAVSSEQTNPQLFADTNETLRTLTIPTSRPLHTSINSSYRRLSGPMPSLLDFNSFEPGSFEVEQEASITMHILNPGPYDLEIQSVKLLPKVL